MYPVCHHNMLHLRVFCAQASFGTPASALLVLQDTTTLAIAVPTVEYHEVSKGVFWSL